MNLFFPFFCSQPYSDVAVCCSLLEYVHLVQIHFGWDFGRASTGMCQPMAQYCTGYGTHAVCNAVCNGM